MFIGSMIRDSLFGQHGHDQHGRAVFKRIAIPASETPFDVFDVSLGGRKWSETVMRNDQVLCCQHLQVSFFGVKAMWAL